jgi:hypothetical protein
MSKANKRKADSMYRLHSCSLSLFLSWTQRDTCVGTTEDAKAAGTVPQTPEEAAALVAIEKLHNTFEEKRFVYSVHTCAHADWWIDCVVFAV